MGGSLPSWADRPTGEEYNGEEGEDLPWYETEYFGGFQYGAQGTSTSTVALRKQSSEFRSRDWGSKYNSTHNLTQIEGTSDFEWVSSGTGETFLKGSANYTSTLIDTVDIDYAYSGTAGGSSFDHSADSLEYRSLTSGWNKTYDNKNNYTLSEVDEGVYGWVKTTGTEKLDATAWGVADYSFNSDWDYNTTGNGWTGDHHGSADLTLYERFDSEYHLDRTSTYDSAGNFTVAGTKSYGKDVTWDLTRNIEDHHLDLAGGVTSAEGYITTDTWDSFAYGHDWSQNLATLAVSTSSTNNVSGDIDWEYGLGLYGADPELNPETYAFAYNLNVPAPGGGMSFLAGAHGTNPENLYLLDAPGTMPAGTFFDANFDVPEEIQYEEVPPPPPEGLPVTETEIDTDGHISGTALLPPRPSQPMRAGSKALALEMAGMPEAAQEYRDAVTYVRNEALPGIAQTIPGASTLLNAYTGITGLNMWDEEVSGFERGMAIVMVGLDMAGAFGAMPKGLGAADEWVSGGRAVSAISTTGELAGDVSNARKVFSKTRAKKLAAVASNPTSVRNLQRALGRARLIDSSEVRLVKATAAETPQFGNLKVLGWISRSGPDGRTLLRDGSGRIIIKITSEGLSSMKTAVETVGHELHHIREALAGAGANEAMAELAGKEFYESFLRRIGNFL